MNQSNGASDFIAFFKRGGRELYLISFIFFMWGLLSCLNDLLVPYLRGVFDLNYTQAMMVQFSFFSAYFLFSIPLGLLINRIGYQKGIVLGLIIMALGCLLFYPAAEYRNFTIFLIGYFTLAGGITVLQVAANPYVALLGSEEGASSRLNLSQAFNSLGTTLAPVVGALFLLSDSVKSSEEINVLSAIEKADYYAAEAYGSNSIFTHCNFYRTFGSCFCLYKITKSNAGES